MEPCGAHGSQGGTVGMQCLDLHRLWIDFLKRDYVYLTAVAYTNRICFMHQSLNV